MGSTEPETILVADNDRDTLRFVDVNLRLEGFDVQLAEDGEEVLRTARVRTPSLVILDTMLPGPDGLDGLEVCRRLRADSRTAHLPIIILTAKALVLDKISGLTAGADDYVLKPFDPQELVARVRTTLRRTGELRTLSPLTGMPGNHRIHAEIARRLSLRDPVALVYADLNDFKAYNDHYGFIRGDEVLSMTANVIRSTLERHASADAFAGHIGGDDFMVLCHLLEVSAVCRAIIDDFDARIASFYDKKDAERGYLDLTDRQGLTCRFSLVSIALGVATTERRSFVDHREMVQVATEMKSYVKRHRRGSSYAVDGRADKGWDRIAGPSWLTGDTRLPGR